VTLNTFSISLMCAVLFGVLVINRVEQAQQDRPVEQTRKNIQVLKGLPESQLFPLMNFVSTSLGVRCDYCHVKNGKNPQTGGDNWLWESDDKPTKGVGRRMMKMVLDINQANFDSNTSVTCYTCHRGNTNAARVPPLPPHEALPTETTRPAAEQILTKYVAAVGVKDAATKIKTTVMKGAVEFDNRTEGRNVQIEVTMKEPDKYLITWTSPQGVQGITAASVNGDVGWVKSSTGVRKLSGSDSEQLKLLKRAASYYVPIKVVDQPAQMRVVGTEKIGNRDAYIVSVAINPNTTRSFFFDTQTGLLLRILTTTETMLAPLPEQVDFEDYRDVDGIKLPFMIRISDAAPFSTATRRFTEIRHNVAVNDEVFNLGTTPP
jgi:Photosynthetic reaction centre cytochrome C subunit